MRKLTPFFVCIALASVTAFAQQPAPQAVASPASTDTASIVPPADDDVPALKKRRNKITYRQQQDAILEAKAKKDSITLHHGISFVTGQLTEKHYGKLDERNVWGSSLGLYYFYRQYFNNFTSLQARLGFLYRYSRFNQDKLYGSVELPSGSDIEVIQRTDLLYNNFSADIPISFKVGEHVEATTFLFAGITLGLNKPFFEHVKYETYLKAGDMDEEGEQAIATLDKLDKNPLYKKKVHRYSKGFSIGDWETGLWWNAGIEGKNVSFEFQMLIISGSTSNNHRFEPIGSGSPTWRILVDFSIK